MAVALGVSERTPTSLESSWQEYYRTLDYIPRQPAKFIVNSDQPVTFYLTVNIDYLSNPLKKLIWGLNL